MGAENTLARQCIACSISWIVASLRNNSLFTAVASDIVPFPFENDVVYPIAAYSPVSLSTGGEVGGVKVMGILRFSVVGVVKGTDITDVQPICNVIDHILHNMFDAAIGTTPFGTVLSCVSKDPVYYSEKDAEKTTYQYLGWVYEIVAQ